MLLDNYKKQSPIVGVAGLGGGINSYIFLSSGGGGDFVISKSLRFNSGDSAYLNRTPSSASNRKTWTWSGWVKRSDISATKTIWASSTLSSIRFATNSEIEWLYEGNYGLKTNAVFRDISAWYHFVFVLDTTNSTADDRQKIYVNGTQLTSFASRGNPSLNSDKQWNAASAHAIGAKPDASVEFDGHLAEINFVDGQALSPTDFGEFDTSGVWQPKKYSGAHGTNGFHLDFKDNSSNAALGYDAAGSNNWTVNNLTALAQSTYGISFDGNDKVTFPGMALGTGDLTFECFFKMDSGTSGFRRILSRTDGGSGNDMIIRVHSNGYMQWYFDSQEHTGSTTVTAGVWHHSAIVRSGSTISYYYDGTRIGTDTSSADMTLNNVILAWGYGSEYFTGEVYGARITKQALYTGASYTVPTSAITTTSQGASSSNVVHLSATTSTTTTNSGTTGNGTDSSDPTAVTAYPFGGPADIDSLLDSPSQIANQTDSGAGGTVNGNYATFNPLQKNSGVTLSNGNLKLQTSSSVWKTTQTTIGMKTGKFYWEFGPYIWKDNSNHCQPGIAGMGIGNLNEMGATNYSAFYHWSGTKFFNGQGGAGSAFGDAWNDNETNIIGIAFDADTRKVWFSKNGVWQGSGNPSAGTNEAGIINLYENGTYSPTLGSYGSLNGGGATANFGQRAFNTAAPSGFKSLCTANLPDPTGPAAEPNKYFDTRSSLLAGGSNDRWTISDLNFSTDLSVSKSTSNDEYWVWTDSVRGFDKVLKSDEDDQEASLGNAITNVSATGFTATNNWFTTGRTYATFNWEAGTSTVTNNDGTSIASQVRAQPSAGFSICTYTGAGSGSANSDSGQSFGHGLGIKPDFVIVKKRSGANGWPVYHSSTPLGALNINSLTSLDTGSYLFAQQHPSNSVVYLGNNPEINASGSTYVAYCFAQILGYSATGKYTGNGSDDGQFIFTGFRPRLIITKAYSSNSNNNNGWVVRDTSRDTFNEATQVIAFENDDPTLNNSHTGIDILSNGFKLKADTNGQSNYNGWDYIYYAVAENPFKTARAR